MLCAIVLPLPSGVISQLNVKVVNGMPDIDMLKPRPSWTSWKVTSCVLPRFVVISSCLPLVIGPSTLADRMPEFHWLQLFGSDHKLQTVPGAAVVERETP
jgi:hypothetical protein